MTTKILSKFPPKDLVENIKAYINAIKLGNLSADLEEIFRWKISGYKKGENWSINWIKEQMAMGIKAPEI